ncbi:MAG: CBS domain-containing membrane protein [Pseudoalteromonas rhizosphaerae]|jgi:CBS domain-containing membrane protein|uniref:CBS domain-containing protein n=1 Tax=Pseudoalteromonas neustonica TaxID=1840331 RepID=A0ABY3FAL8_9GAMM|nr:MULTISPECIES: CBS domain-containing protein [Pseudoalteromonas]MBB1300778.1 CBS domain-containing protein [Pseudoalteromonas sp. SR44-8]MBB1308889.1 CBS domain-containing protein [Pseudoalteromonas sp. SR41-8]MBB1399642.1 CBS domain-containing protein [Pseudoalteromonas sp. SG44-8]MBB1408191.1 CBS domain-containing protein [Pseudoalteromonas sp. SG44-17]TVU81210.1 CBS domain-containing protein [Pseudoalteromonas neustonica]
MSQTVADLMTSDPFAVSAENTLHDAHNLMKEKNIRHIPVIDNNGELVGMLTQKIMIAQVMNIMANYSPSALERKEKQTKIHTIMATDFATVLATQPLQDVARFFVDNRHGCMPVITEKNKLVGILTSSDFVRLAAALLS